MNGNFLLLPPVAFVLFLLLIGGLYLFIRKQAPKGKDSIEKTQPYSGGQDIPQHEVQLGYEAFFRIGLLFGILHVAVLVIATLPTAWDARLMGVIYLAGIAISVFALSKGMAE